MPPTVHYLSHGATTGYGEAGRRMVLALEAAGAKVRWTPITFDPSGPLFADEQVVVPALEHLRRRSFSADVAVVHAIPEMIANVRPLAEGSTFVSHTVWETDRLQPHWPALLEEVDGVIVPTEWNAEVFRTSGVTAPVEVVPHVADQVRGDQAIDVAWLPERARPGQDQGPVLLSVAEWQPRKAPWLTLEAYARAFDRDDDVLLVLKTGERVWGHMVDPADASPRRDHTSWAVAKAVGRLGPLPPLHLVDRWITPGQMAGLHEAADAYVSLPHGEGWDLGAFDAATRGTPVVTTGWGAPATYLDPAASWLVPGELVPVPALPGDATPGEGPGRWVDPDLDAAAEALREAVDLGAERRAAVAAQAERLRTTYAPEAVAATFLEAVGRIHGA